MDPSQHLPAGPRGRIGAAAESAAAIHLRQAGWTILGRNLRVGRDEIDILALEAGSQRLVVVEVRARSGPAFGSALESVDGAKVSRLYRAAAALLRTGHPDIAGADVRERSWRVDLLALRRTARGQWTVECHLRGLRPP